MPFDRAHEIRPDRSLFAREESAGAPAADRDFIGDQVHAEFVAQRAELRQVRRIVHRHAGRALHERFDDHRREILRARFEERAHVGERMLSGIGAFRAHPAM